MMAQREEEGRDDGTEDGGGERRGRAEYDKYVMGHDDWMAVEGVWW